MIPPIHIEIPLLAWDSMQDGRMFCTVEIGGQLHHLEAVPVKWTKTGEQQGADARSEDVLSEYCDAFGATSPFGTVSIKGRHYALFMSPFCE